MDKKSYVTSLIKEKFSDIELIEIVELEKSEWVILGNGVLATILGFDLTNTIEVVTNNGMGVKEAITLNLETDLGIDRWRGTV